MFGTIVKAKQNVMLLGLAFALVGVGTAPLVDGLEVDAAKRGRNRDKPATAATRVVADTTRRFENRDVPLGTVDGPGKIASPSTIEVSGLTGTVIDVNVELMSIVHRPASTADLDVLLIGPDGQSAALILSDVGGATATRDVTLTLDDQALQPLPSATALTAGSFQPTNIASPDTMDLGAGLATTPSQSALATFNGINPNGTWQLWAQDDTPNGSGLVGDGIKGGWAVTITTNSAPEAKPDRFQAKAGKTLRVNAAGVLRNDTDPDGDALTAVLVQAPQKGQLVLDPDGSFTYRANRQARGRDSFTYLARDEHGSTAQATVSLQIKPQNAKQLKRNNGVRRGGR